MVAAAYTVVALLLGFTFSMALGRFEARRSNVVDEANAIQVLAMRSVLLGPKAAGALRADLRDYARARISLVRHSSDAAAVKVAVARSKALQKVMWQLIAAGALRNPQSNLGPVVILTFNDLTGISNEEEAILTFYVPQSVMLMLIGIAFISSLLMGFRFGRHGDRGVVVTTTLALMLAIAIGIVIDLGAPQPGGFISVGAERLEAVQAQI